MSASQNQIGHGVPHNLPTHLGYIIPLYTRLQFIGREDSEQMVQVGLSNNGTNKSYIFQIKKATLLDALKKLELVKKT